MENLWQRLEPAVKNKVLENEEKYPYLVEDVKHELKKHKFWTDLPISTARQVVNFSHDTIFDVSMSDFVWGEKFIKNS
tara:strand:- start:626 stop:859 length:234 start_codon:yes stop_codon:yes gene_type:complete